MKLIKRLLDDGIYAPFFIVAQSIFLIYTPNAPLWSVDSLWRVLVFWLACTFLVVFFANRFSQNQKLTNAKLALFLTVFFWFGPLADIIGPPLNLNWWARNLVGLVVLVVFVLLIRGLVMRLPVKRQKEVLTTVANGWSISMMAVAIYGLVTIPRVAMPESIPPVVRPSEHTATRPDVYYIILDAYGREDVLKSVYGFDNSFFIQELRKRGFYVADDSDANYIQTSLSLASSLNMDYVPVVQKERGPFRIREDLYETIRTSKVREIFAEQGYSMASFANSFQTAAQNAQFYYVTPEYKDNSDIVSLGTLVFNRSLLRVLVAVPLVRDAIYRPDYDKHRRQVLYTLETLPTLSQKETDLFVFAHIISPHPPFVFDENGTPVEHYIPFALSDASHYRQAQSRESYMDGYRKQITFLNERILTVVDALLSAPGPKPIIILQGDHGPGAFLDWESYEQSRPDERFGILNAYYFPDGNYAQLTPDISPVNTFRVILNQYFGANYSLLDNRNYYSTWSAPLKFIDTTDALKTGP